jgi:hypothetical protein
MGFVARHPKKGCLVSFCIFDFIFQIHEAAISFPGSLSCSRLFEDEKERMYPREKATFWLARFMSMISRHAGEAPAALVVTGAPSCEVERPVVGGFQAALKARSRRVAVVYKESRVSCCARVRTWVADFQRWPPPHERVTESETGTAGRTSRHRRCRLHGHPTRTDTQERERWRGWLISLAGIFRLAVFDIIVSTLKKQVEHALLRSRNLCISRIISSLPPTCPRLAVAWNGMSKRMLPSRNRKSSQG